MYFVPPAKNVRKIFDKRMAYSAWVPVWHVALMGTTAVLHCHCRPTWFKALNVYNNTTQVLSAWLFLFAFHFSLFLIHLSLSVHPWRQFKVSPVDLPHHQGIFYISHTKRRWDRRWDRQKDNICLEVTTRQNETVVGSLVRWLSGRVLDYWPRGPGSIPGKARHSQLML